MFNIDSSSGSPVFEQIREQLEMSVLNGVLKPGDRLPSVRAVSVGQSINPRTVMRAYSELEGKGVIKAVPGKGYFVLDNALSALKGASIAELSGVADAVAKMALAGVSRELVINVVNNAYDSVLHSREQ